MDNRAARECFGETTTMNFQILLGVGFGGGGQDCVIGYMIATVNGSVSLVTAILDTARDVEGEDSSGREGDEGQRDEDAKVAIKNKLVRMPLKIRRQRLPGLYRAFAPALSTRDKGACKDLEQKKNKNNGELRTRLESTGKSHRRAIWARNIGRSRAWLWRTEELTVSRAAAMEAVSVAGRARRGGAAVAPAVEAMVRRQ